MTTMEARDGAQGADVCLLLEGTYPYVRGGVSAWIHDLITGLPELRFSLVHIGPEHGRYTQRHYPLPANVAGLTDLYCREPPARRRDAVACERAARAARHRHARAGRTSRVLLGLRRLHLEDRMDSSLIEDLASGDLSIDELLHGHGSFELTTELCERLAPEASFVDVFWHLRSMHLPLVRLLGAAPPPASLYHALCTGYAGILGAVWSQRTDRPFLLTEHGIYARERVLELDRATWLLRTRDRWRSDRTFGPVESPTASALRSMWVRFFGALAWCAYDQASTVVSLSEFSRRRQIADGAPAERTCVIPNGIEPEPRGPGQAVPSMESGRRRVRIAFVGRMVPIKDVVTFIRACALALQTLDLDVRIYGPIDEEPRYVRRCRRLVARLGLEGRIHLEGSRPPEQIYAGIDILVLTSLSEGQPLVILEANAAGIPVVAPDVGACRELLEGRSELDRRFGPSGIVTGLAAPEATAAAIQRLARNPKLRRRMGDAGRRRVITFYEKRGVIAAYRSLYAGGSWQVSAGVSSA